MPHEQLINYRRWIRANLQLLLAVLSPGHGWINTSLEHYRFGSYQWPSLSGQY